MTEELTLSVARVVSSTSTDGPGLRTALYLQGCDIRCPGCHNSSLWDIDKGTLMSIEDVWKQLDETDENISILGGEPLMQYKPLIFLCRLIKERSKKSIWLWTGHPIHEVTQTFPEILDWVDVIVDGPFSSKHASPDLRFRGSANQWIIPVSDIGMEECEKMQMNSI